MAKEAKGVVAKFAVETLESRKNDSQKTKLAWTADVQTTAPPEQKGSFVARAVEKEYECADQQHPQPTIRVL